MARKISYPFVLKRKLAPVALGNPKIIASAGH
jgi:hypothetical protein